MEIERQARERDRGNREEGEDVSRRNIFLYRKLNIFSDQILRHLMGSFSVALISINARS
jgi:hypothetical protein